MRELELVTNSTLTPALRLYESAGFRQGPHPRAPGYARGDVYMRLPLADP
jgi:hypothetical protein